MVAHGAETLMKTPRSVPDLLKLHPGAYRQPFLFFKDESWTLKEIDAVSDIAARQLRLCHIQPGDRVAMLLPNSPEFVIYFIAALKIGAVAVPINVLLKEPEIAFILKDCGAAGLLIGPAHHESSESLLKQAGSLRFAQKIDAGQPKRELARRLAPFEPQEGEEPSEKWVLEPSTPASIIYTSGTTGFPKGAVLTHGNYLFDVRQFVKAIAMTPRDRFLCFLPLFHVNGQVVTLLSPLYAGGSMVLMEKFQPKEFFELLSRHKCTAFSGVPSVYSVLLNVPEAAAYDLSSLRFCICGAAPMPVDVFERFEARFKAHIMEGYGLSEATCVSSVNPPPPGKRKIGSIGLALDEQEMMVVDEQGEELPRGKVGEIVVRGRNVMQGYWNNPIATAEAIKHGWLRTGDLGYQDEEGYFFISGRKKEMIIRGGENIYPKEIEEALYRHPGVAEAAVVGLPDKRWGEEPAAFIVLKEGQTLSARDLTGYLKERLADYKIPRKVVFVASLPKTATGKIQKLKLRDEYLSKGQA